jgi:hypothetical protein
MTPETRQLGEATRMKNYWARAKAIYALRLAGHTYKQIGALVGIRTPNAVRIAYERYKASIDTKPIEA